MPTPSNSCNARRSGVALVLVLSVLVLLSALLVAFVTSATTENTAAATYAHGLEAQQAAETATNLIIAQIREGTKNEGGGSTWASQPGAIWNFGRGTAENRVFKLYSSDTMHVTEAEFLPQDEVGFEPGDPTRLLDGYVDLNAPVMIPVEGSTPEDPAMEPRYPIVNPYPKYRYQPGSGSKSGTFLTTSTPMPGQEAVEGFYCGDVADPAGRKDASGQTLRLLPMPARWMYILKDGKVAALGNDMKIREATKENPPVARIAFWADDESTKVNINTAAEGTYWDTPVVSTMQESGNIDGSGAVNTGILNSSNHSVSQPARGEYQRFPGHPATTSLSPVLRWLFHSPGRYNYTTVTNPPYSETPTELQPLMQPQILNLKEAIYRRAPRITGGDSSSLAGTRRTPGPESGVVSGGLRAPDTDRLYASVDEYFFRPDRTGQDTLESVWVRDPNRPSESGRADQPIPGFNPEGLEKVRFFLTAHSRSPELNIHGRPRMTVWPVNKALQMRSSFDDLFAFCSTMAGREYYFERSNPNSATEDFEDNPQNQNLYSYLQQMTAAPIPFSTAGRSFRDKYGAANRDQILTQIFDYIRCVNLQDTGKSSQNPNQVPIRKDPQSPNLAPSDYRYPLAYTRFFWKDQEGQGTSYGAGQVVPLRIKATYNRESGIDTQGFGRFVTISEAAIMFFRPNTIPNGGLRAAFIFDMYTPSMGYPGMAERYSVRVRFPLPEALDEKLEWAVAPPSGGDVAARIPLNFPRDSVNIVDVDAYTAPIGRMFMPTRGFNGQFLYTTQGWDTAPKRFAGSPNVPPNPNPFGGGNYRRDVYPFVSEPIPLPPGTGRFEFIGGDVIVEVYASHNPTPSEEPVQRFHFNFPVPVSAGSNSPAALPMPTGSDLESRLTRGINGQRNSGLGTEMDRGYGWIEGGDVIRSLQPSFAMTQGDIRLTMARPEVPKTFFAPANMPKYNSATNLQHSLTLGRGRPYTGALINEFGKLVPNATWRSDRPPKVPFGVNGVRMRNGGAGEWDRGISKNVDGPFINKADEGNVNFEPGRGGLGIPYFLGFSGFAEVGPTYFSPNRLMSSPVMFGSLPSRVYDPQPGHWETLLFRPPVTKDANGNPTAVEHRGFADPPDHYLLDLFHMPVVEPYAISEPFSTAGKLNLNYTIAPYGYLPVTGGPVGAAYIERKTGIHALLKAVKVLLVEPNIVQAGHQESPESDNTKVRFTIDRLSTIKLIDKRLADNGLFKTASEICEVDLVPSGIPGVNERTNWAQFWSRYTLTGDNGRERPYSMIYPRVTTKSNVYTVHIRAQSIRKNPQTPVDEFVEGRDQVMSDYRGSSIVERYLDPNDTAFSTYDPETDGGLDPYYRFRVVNTKRFVP